LRRVIVSETKLKPCPFCGKQVLVHKYYSEMDGIRYSVRCMNDKCLSIATDEYREERKAAFAWNRRAAIKGKEVQA
jgi:Lar family restriction alleviation protein